MRLGIIYRDSERPEPLSRSLEIVLRRKTDWALLEFKASETNILPQAELEAARKEMGDDKYFQEFECSFSAAVEGSYYGTILNELAEERFKEIPSVTTSARPLRPGIWGWGTLRQYGLSKLRAKRFRMHGLY
jgi:hypothetical protein